MVGLAFGGGYLIFVALTIRVVRGVPVEPGAWLGRRDVRRALVLVVALMCLLLTAQPAPGQAQVQLPVLLIVAFCLVLLGRATRRIASAPEYAVDERQEALRNRAHRIAYGLLAVSVGATVLIADLASSDSRRWLAGAIQGGPVFAFLILLFFLPTMVIAWLEPDRLADETAAARMASPRARLGLAMVATCLLVPFLLSAGLAVLPVSTTAYTAPASDEPDSNCKFFQAYRQAGVGIFAGIQLSAEACWDGKHAYPKWGLSSSDCHVLTAALAQVTTARCSRTTDSEGSLHFTYQAIVRPSLLPFVTRELAVHLTLARDGKVVQFP